MEYQRPSRQRQWKNTLNLDWTDKNQKVVKLLEFLALLYNQNSSAREAIKWVLLSIAWAHIVQLQSDVHNFNAHLHQFPCNSLRVFFAKQIFEEIYWVYDLALTKMLLLISQIDLDLLLWWVEHNKLNVRERIFFTKMKLAKVSGENEN